MPSYAGETRRFTAVGRLADTGPAGWAGLAQTLFAPPETRLWRSAWLRRLASLAAIGGAFFVLAALGTLTKSQDANTQLESC